MISTKTKIESVEYQDDIKCTIVVRTKANTNYEAKIKKKTITSGCAQGTVFGNVMEKF